MTARPTSFRGTGRRKPDSNLRRLELSRLVQRLSAPAESKASQPQAEQGEGVRERDLANGRQLKGTGYRGSIRARQGIALLCLKTGDTSAEVCRIENKRLAEWPEGPGDAQSSKEVDETGWAAIEKSSYDSQAIR